MSTHVSNQGSPFDWVYCVSGLKGAGKDEFCRRMAEQHGYATVRFSDPIREEAVRRFGPQYAVEQLIEIGNEGRRQGGPGYWAAQLLAAAEAKGQRRLVINGARNPGEVGATLDCVGFNRLSLVGITAPSFLRYQRITKRGQVEDRAEMEKFLQMDDADRGIGQPWDGQQVDRTMALVPMGNVYNNAGTLAEYHAWIDALVAGAQKTEDVARFGGEF